jgi:hypothetical protein
MEKVVNITGHPFQRRSPMERTLAEWMARKRIKEQWRASGRHPYDLRTADLRRAAEFYLFQHTSELMAEVAALIARDPKLREMAEIEKRRAEKRRAEITSDAQRERR